MKMLYTIAFPMIITGLLIYGKSLISMLFLGKLSKDALAGGSLAIAIANISGYSVIYGLSLGMEPISSQAFGAKQWPLLSQTLHRTLLLLLLTCIPISILWLNIHPFLLFFNLDSSISAVASPYLAFSLPSLLFQSLINPLKIYLRAQNIISPIMSSAAVALVFHVPTAYLLVAHLRLGVPGVALASAAADMAQLTTLLSHVDNLSSLGCGGCAATAKEWRALLQLALPSCAAVCLEWWWYEIMILLAGVLPDAAEAVACMGILIQATSLAYVFPSALGLAASVRVGNELGAGGVPGGGRMRGRHQLGNLVVHASYSRRVGPGVHGRQGRGRPYGGADAGGGALRAGKLPADHRVWGAEGKREGVPQLPYKCGVILWGWIATGNMDGLCVGNGPVGVMVGPTGGPNRVRDAHGSDIVHHGLGS